VHELSIKCFGLSFFKTGIIQMGMKKFIKSKEFLSQIPSWEKNYKKDDTLQIAYDKSDWRTAPAVFSDHDLTILGEAVMEDWETPYMRELASIATSRGGTILEVGFGMGISANFIQQADIDRHIIIEANQDVAAKARNFAARALHKTEVIEGMWEDVIGCIPHETINGILFDSYPLCEEELYQNHFAFFPYAYSKLTGGGIHILL